MTNSCPPSNPSATPPPSPARQRFLQRLAALSIKPTTHEYYVRWAEAWNKALGHRSAERTHAVVSTTMIYLHVIKRPGAGGPSPLDLP